MRTSQPRFLRTILAGLAIIVFLSSTSHSRAFGATESVLHSFTGAPGDGYGPHGLVKDANGNLYSTTLSGGSYNGGTVFELTPAGSGWSESIIWDFGSGIDGSGPQGGLIIDLAGNLYGTTNNGGTHNGGTVFAVSPNGLGGWSEAVLYNFGDLNGDGLHPLDRLTMDPSGNLYGTTSAGGTGGNGTVFELSPSGSGWNETVLLSFSGASDGAAPRGGVIRDTAGNLYGTAQQGGTFNSGTAFELSPPAVAGNPWTEKVLWAFGSGSDGRGPGADLISDSSGNLYGTTWDGGVYDCHCINNYGGTVFKLRPPTSPGGNWTEAVIWNLGGSSGKPNAKIIDGQLPWASGLLLDSGGNLFGTAMKGGTYGGGTAFKLTPPSGTGSAWTETILWNFSGLDGKFPQNGLITIDTTGALYGSTNNGGISGDGTVFKITP